MKHVIPAAPLHTLSIAGGEGHFPVNRVFCVGRNYAAHAREMGRDPERELPFFFMKPASAVVDAAQPATLPYPPRTQNFHHEIELVVAIGEGGNDISVDGALDHIYGYAVGPAHDRYTGGPRRRDAGRFNGGGDCRAGPDRGDRKSLSGCGSMRIGDEHE